MLILGDSDIIVNGILAPLSISEYGGYDLYRPIQEMEPYETYIFQLQPEQ
jgi:hypothetical protein